VLLRSPLVVDELAVLITHHFLLTLHHLHPFVADLISAQVVSLYNLSLVQTIVVAIGPQALVLLVDKVLGSFAVHALLLTVLLEALHVRHTLLSDCPKHLIALTVSVTLLHGLLILLHAHRIVEGISVLASLLHL